MRILVVDDDEQKRADVRRCLEAAELGVDLHVCEAKNYETALEQLRDQFFELVVLDVLLPGADGDPNPMFSRALIRKITAGQDLIPPTNIIALTAYQQVVDAERAFYEEHIFAIELYDAIDARWSERLVRKIKYLRRAKRAGAEFYRNSFDFDVVVLTARYENEFLPVRDVLLEEVTGDTFAGWRAPVALGVIPGPNGRMLRTAVVCVSEMGMATTAAVTSEAISAFRPRLVAMLGMCCGFDVPEASVEQKMLNAIVVRETSCWEVGKYVDAVAGSEFKNRSKPRFVDDLLRDEIDDIIERQVDTLSGAIKKLIGQPGMKRTIAKLPQDKIGSVPEVRFGTLVSGSSVIANRERIVEIIERHPAALGLDMEVYGLYTAAEKALGRRPSVLAIKGVADFGDAKKSDVAQKAASQVASAVFRAIVGQLRMFGGSDQGG